MKCGSKKVKKFASGGWNSISSMDPAEATGLEDIKVTTARKSVEAPKQSFGEAFKAARGAGSTEFTWNGKKYNTKLKEDAPKASPKLEGTTVTAKREGPRKFAGTGDSPLPKIAAPKPDAAKFTANGPTGVTRYVPGAEKALAEQRERSRRAVQGYAKGGKVRGDGCCVQGKTKGRFR